ncbi:hypothetical protein HRbin34_00426 [bacterium HR34]|nr:hypothetical protein HRbin34_00426 [bacterium HR34]
MSHEVILNSIGLINLIYLIAAVVTVLIIFIILSKVQKKQVIHKSLDLKLLLVTIPKEELSKDQQKQPLQEFLKVVEQFYNSLSYLKSKGIFQSAFSYKPSIVFEIAVHRLGEEIYFYVAVPSKSVETVEKLILGFWPKAQIQQTIDYNIFNPLGESVGSYAYLPKHYILPIKTYEEFGADPMSAITSVFTKLKKEGEGAAMQIVLRPTSKDIKSFAHKVIRKMEEGYSFENALNKISEFTRAVESVSQAVKSKEEKEKLQPKEPQKTPTDEKIIKAITEKAARPNFDVNIRLLASAKDKERAEEILSQLESAFDQFSAMDLNQIKFKKAKRKRLEDLFFNFSFRIFDPRETITLSSTELAGIFHFPSPDLLTPYIKWLRTKETPPPPNLPTSGIRIGRNVYRGEEKPVYLQTDDRRRHFYIIGQTGTGKSALLYEMVRQDIEEGHGVCLIDPHGDLAEKVLSVVPENRIEDVIYFDPGDVEMPIGLNMLEYDPKYPVYKTFIVNELIEIFDKLYDLKQTGGPMFEQYMRNALLLVMEHPQSGNTLLEVPRVLSDEEFRHYKLSKCKNIVVKNFWEKEAERAGGESALANMVPYITSKMNIFIANDYVRPIIAQQRSTINFREVLDTSKIFIVNLSKGKLGDINSYLLGMVIVGKLLMAAFSRIDLPEEQRKDFYLYIDEFQNITTNTIATILSEARKYKLNLTVAHQFIGQLTEDIQKAVFGNVGSKLAFRVGPDDAKYLVSEFGPVFTEDDLVNIENYNAACKMLINGEPTKPFSIKTYPPQPGNSEIVGRIKTFSRQTYGRPLEVVEMEIYKRLSKAF